MPVIPWRRAAAEPREKAGCSMGCRSWKSLQWLALAALLAPACDHNSPSQTTSVAATPTPPADTWIDHLDAEGGFTVRLPGKPTMQTTKIPTEVGEFELHTAAYEVPFRDIYIAVMWSALPEILVKMGATEKMLDGGVEGMLNNIKGTLVEPAKHVELEHHPGRDVRLTASVDDKQVKARARMFVVHDRMFQMLILCEASDQYDPEIDKLFASFALTPDFAGKHGEVVKFDWQPYKPADGKFTAKLPVADPTVTTEKQTTAGQELETTTIVASAERSYAVFMIGHFELPASAKGQKPEQLFALGRDGAAASASAKLVGTPEPSPLGKLPGEKYKLESEGGLMTIDGRSYIDGNRFYFVMALRPRNSKVDQTELDAFFAGFEPKSK